MAGSLAPPARTSKQRLGQVQRLTEARTSALAQSAREAGELGFYARVLAQVTLPHHDPGPILAWSRRNGNVALLMQPGVDVTPAGEARSLGLPFGCIPRLTLTYIVSEAVATNSPEIDLLTSARQFLRRLDPVSPDLSGTGYRRLHQQVDRLLSTRVILRAVGVAAQATYSIASSHALWWDPKRPEDTGLWSSSLVLSEEFYCAVRHRPVPIDWRAVRALNGSSMALDIYTWLTWRLHHLEKPVLISWASLAAQFGSDYARTRDFRRWFLQALRKVQHVYPEARVEPKEEGLVIAPSPTHVARLPSA